MTANTKEREPLDKTGITAPVLQVTRQERCVQGNEETSPNQAHYLTQLHREPGKRGQGMCACVLGTVAGKRA